MLIETWPHHRLKVSEPPGTVLAITPQGIEVACDPGVLRVTRVKPEAKAEMGAAEWARGARLEPGEALEMEKEAHA